MATIGDRFRGLDDETKGNVVRIVEAVADWIDVERENLLEDPGSVEIPVPGGMELLDMTVDELEARAEALSDSTGQKLEQQRDRIRRAQGIVNALFEIAIEAATTAALSAVGGG